MKLWFSLYRKGEGTSCSQTDHGHHAGDELCRPEPLPGHSCWWAGPGRSLRGVAWAEPSVGVATGGQGQAELLSPSGPGQPTSPGPKEA